MFKLMRALSLHHHCCQPKAMGAPYSAIRLSVKRGLQSTSVLPLDPGVVLTYRGFQTLTRKADYMQGRPTEQPFSSQLSAAASSQLLLFMSFPGRLISVKGHKPVNHNFCGSFSCLIMKIFLLYLPFSVSKTWLELHLKGWGTEQSIMYPTGPALLHSSSQRWLTFPGRDPNTDSANETETWLLSNQRLISTGQDITLYLGQCCNVCVVQTRDSPQVRWSRCNNPSEL